MSVRGSVFGVGFPTMDFTPLMPHGEIEEVFADVYFVTGTTKPEFDGKIWQFSRNMTIVRHGTELTLVNTLRLDDDGLAKLESLGTVKNIVKLGGFHGIDDAFYLDRYGANQWALAGAEHFAGHKTDEELSANNTPFPAKLFEFESSKTPEGVLLIEREGGILISCDSLQNWVEVDGYFSEETGATMTQFGFIKPANVGPGWIRAVDPKPTDFARLKQLSFVHLLPGHGKPLKTTAHAELSATFAELFGV